MTTPAVRTVSETDDVHVIEGLAFPFKSRDTYGTFFSARTNFEWGLFPDVEPGATRDGGPGFIRPVTFHHGFDKDFGLARMGGWSPVRADADGVWVQAQLDKRQAYYATRIKPLLDKNALGLSGGSAEHSVRIDQATGEVLDWPAYEVALTPVESNPLAQLSVRAGEAIASLRVVAARSEQAALPSATGTRNAYSEAASNASYGASILGQMTDLLGSESDEPEQADHIRNAIAEWSAWLALERAEIGTTEDAAESQPDGYTVVTTETVAYAAGVRATQLRAIHDIAVRLEAALTASPTTDTPARRSDDSDGDDQPANVQIAVRTDPAKEFEEMKARLATRAADAGAEVARKLTG